jgi:hypothetical protein
MDGFADVPEGPIKGLNVIGDIHGDPPQSFPIQASGCPDRQQKTLFPQRRNRVLKS